MAIEEINFLENPKRSQEILKLIGEISVPLLVHQGKPYTYQNSQKIFWQSK